MNLYKHTKPHHQGRMYKYALLRNRNFGAKNTVNRFYNTTSSSRFSQSSISHKENHQRKANRLATSTFFLIFVKKTYFAYTQ